MLVILGFLEFYYQIGLLELFRVARDRVVKSGLYEQLGRVVNFGS